MSVLDEFFVISFAHERQAAVSTSIGEAVQSWTQISTGLCFIWPNSGQAIADYATQGIMSTDTMATYETDWRAGDRVIADGITYYVEAGPNKYNTAPMIDIADYYTVPLTSRRSGTT